MPCSGYEKLASEYYSQSHVTSRNFDEATEGFLSKIALVIPPDGLILDIGSGRGRVGEYLRVDPNRVIQADSSRSMLRLTPRERSFARIQADASSLPFSDNCFSVVTAFLFDPFNTESFLEEAARVLAKDGLFVGTLPSLEWGRSLRRLRNHPLDRATFLSTSREAVACPSFLTSNQEIERRLDQAGFSKVSISEVLLPASATRVSPDISDAARCLGVLHFQLPILTLAVATA
jgi:ubiquinone/menaquinone biosynthesis C-methylase UbiE